MPVYTADSRSPLLYDSITGKPIGYTGNDGKQYDLTGVLLGTNTNVPLMSLDPAAGLLLGGAAPNEQQRAAVRAGIGGWGSSGQAMLTIAAGNSIAAQSKIDGLGRWGATGELQLANMFCGSAMRFMRIASTTRSDINGVYGYSGATLDAINGDIEAQWFAPMHAASMTPGLVVGLALLENDVAQDATVPQMAARVSRWLSNVRRFPGVQVILCTPRPSFSNNTPSRVAAFAAITDHLLGLDDGKSVFVADMRGYEDVTNPAQPMAGFTDSSVHPNAKGAMLNARIIASAINRVVGNVVQPYRVLSNNYGLAGSSAASGAGVSGTWPTYCGTGAGADGHTLVLEAQNPGYAATLIVEAGQTKGSPTLSTGAIAITGGASTQISTFAEVEIISGAENLRSINLQPRIMDGSGNNFQYHIVPTSADVDPDYKNGDILTIRTPPMIAASGSISQVVPYLGMQCKSAGGSTSTVTGSVSIVVRNTGVGLVVA